MGRVTNRFRSSNRPPRLARGVDFPRLLTALVLLGVLGLMIATAKDPANWRWLATSDVPVSNLEKPSHQVACVVPGPTDLDKSEAAAALPELARVADNRPLLPEEMPAYWRCLRWSRAQTDQQLSDRARNDLTFTHLFQSPARYRGKVVNLRLHLVRALAFETTDSVGAPKDLNRVYEAWGPTAESQSNPYVVVFANSPLGFPIAAKIDETATFSGYFLKLLAYQAGDDKWRAAPLLVGRLEWQPGIKSRPPAPAGGPPTGALVFAGCVAFLVVRWGIIPWLGRRSKVETGPIASNDSVEAWLRGDSSPIDGPSSLHQ